MTILKTILKINYYKAINKFKGTSIKLWRKGSVVKTRKNYQYLKAHPKLYPAILIQKVVAKRIV